MVSHVRDFRRRTIYSYGPGSLGYSGSNVYDNAIRSQVRHSLLGLHQGHEAEAADPRAIGKAGQEREQ